MDVDLLRPGTVPLSPDTVLWFEFLLDPNLLFKHLNKSFPEPSACELIVEFLSVDTKVGNIKPGSERVVDVDAPASPSPPSRPGSPVQYTRKQLALKILALKVAATLKWNLDIFETKLPPQIQQQLVQDFVYMATDAAFANPPLDLPPDLLQKPHVLFALTLYHRWILRFPVKAALQAKSNKMALIHMPGMPTDIGYSPVSPIFEKILRASENSRLQSITFLEEILNYFALNTTSRRETPKIKIPVMATFVHLTENSDDINHNWSAGDVSISQYELIMQIHYDLCYNYFFYGQYDMARKHILACKESANLLEREITFYGYGYHKTVPWGTFDYASVSKEDIYGYIRALNLGYEILGEEPTLLQKLQESIANHYTGIIAVLQADNIAREIPMIHRQLVELDIQGSASSGAFTVARDLLSRVSALNAVRYALEGGLPSSQPDFINKFKTVGIKFVDLLFWASAPVLINPLLTEKDWKNLQVFFLHLAASPCRFPIERIDEYLRKHIGDDAENIKNKLITNEHISCIINDPINCDDENMEIPRELLTDDWDTPDFEFKTVPELEMCRLKKRLIEASTADDVRMCLVKLAMKAPSSPLWKLSPSWKPAGGLGNALVALPRGFLQDFGYVVSGAARARAEAGCGRMALSLLSVLEGEARGQLGGGTDPVLYRLVRLLSWEVLLLQINVMINEWPNHRLNVSALVNKSKACIASANSGDSVLPRSQVVEACWTCLVNTCEWEGVVNTPGSAGEAGYYLCAACVELQRGKGLRKFPRQLWDYALSVYGNGSAGTTKRTAAGLSTHSRDTMNTSIDSRNAFNTFLGALREPLAVSIMSSLLARIHNLLIDDSTLDLSVEYLNLWPSNISNMSNYNVKHVLESLTDLLESNLKIYPYNTSWLRILGDVECAAGRHGAAMKYYLCSLAAGSWHFAKRAPDEGAIARRAARCAQAMGCPTQAAALAQLPDEPDYPSAFKCLAEKAGNAADAMDSYYVSIWDGTLLELAVALHSRRGEVGRKARAVRAAGALELNANNGEDIQREAAAARRARLLRALARQYVT